MLRPSQASCKMFGATAGLIYPRTKTIFNSPVYLALIFPALYLTHRQKQRNKKEKRK